MSYELDRLRKWKKEAKQVMADWEKVWVAMGCPGDLGQSKAEACLQQLTRADAHGRADNSGLDIESPVTADSLSDGPDTGTASDAN